MGGNRKHGFLRGNRNGRNGSNTPRSWYCTGCETSHVGTTERTGIYQVGDFCNKTYFKRKEAEK
jgi:hypothetical protein